MSARTWSITASLVAGFLAGLAAALYLMYAWVPSALIVRDAEIVSASPRNLKSGENGKSVEYRDFYAVQVARRYQTRLQNNESKENAISEVENAMGHAGGSATRAQILEIFSAAYNAAHNENTKDADGGFMTTADEFLLANVRDEIKLRVDTIPEDKKSSAELAAEALNQRRLLGLTALLVVLGVAGLLAYLGTWLEQREKLANLVPSALPVVAEVAQQQAQVFRPAAVPAQSSFAQPAAPPPQPIFIQQVVQPVEPAATATQLAGVGVGANTQVPTGILAPDPAASRNETFLTSFDPTSYRHGEDSYEEGFTINSATGEFLGECGVSIAERFDVGSPAKVCALGVWVFDKNDAQFKSVSKVLMTPNAFNDAVIRTKLARLGEHVLAQPGTFDIDTATMRVEVNVSELNVNPSGFFENVNLAFNIYRKTTV
jgi:hypothetical protein